ncbi:MAG: hypothetical protein ACLFUS_01005, partial [Candidatus Sumerlaeia bacterium]
YLMPFPTQKIKRLSAEATRIHEVEIQGYVFLAAVYRNTRTTRKDDVDIPSRKFRCNVACKFQAIHF